MLCTCAVYTETNKFSTKLFENSKEFMLYLRDQELQGSKMILICMFYLLKLKQLFLMCSIQSMEYTSKTSDKKTQICFILEHLSGFIF